MNKPKYLVSLALTIILILSLAPLSWGAGKKPAGKSVKKTSPSPTLTAAPKTAAVPTVAVEKKISQAQVEKYLYAKEEYQSEKQMVVGFQEDSQAIKNGLTAYAANPVTLTGATLKKYLRLLADSRTPAVSLNELLMAWAGDGQQAEDLRLLALENLYLNDGAEASALNKTTELNAKTSAFLKKELLAEEVPLSLRLACLGFWQSFSPYEKNDIKGLPLALKKSQEEMQAGAEALLQLTNFDLVSHTHYVLLWGMTFDESTRSWVKSELGRSWLEQYPQGEELRRAYVRAKAEPGSGQVKKDFLELFHAILGLKPGPDKLYVPAIAFLFDLRYPDTKKILVQEVSSREGPVCEELIKALFQYNKIELQ